MIALYGHPFSSFTWKVLVAAYERRVPFAFQMIDGDHPDAAARIAQLSPTGQFPALVDGDLEITQSNVIIEYLDSVGDAAPLIPADRVAALRARMLGEVFDDYIHVPMQRIVSECFRGDGEKDPCGVADAHDKLERTYAWLEDRIGDAWAAGAAFTIADCAASGAIFYADWVRPIPEGRLKAYRSRLLAHPSVARAVDEARPYRHFFPLGAPDRD